MKLSASDATVSAVALVLSMVLLYLFLQEAGHVTVRRDERPLGTVVFKKLNATRRMSGTLVWERIRTSTAVYEADTLRTTTASEASIQFEDGTSLDMNENSMLRLNFAGKEHILEFLGGNISVSGTTAGAGGGKAAPAYTIAAGDRTITVSSGSAADVSRTGDTLSVAVAAGEVGVTQGDGQTQMLDRTQALEVGLKSGASRLVERKLVPRSPDQNARFLLQRPGSAEVEFSWEARGTEGVMLELSTNKDFAPVWRSVPTTGDSVHVSVDPGSWYWRLRAGDGTFSSLGRFSLLSELLPRPILPAAGTTVLFRTRTPEIRFSWTTMTDAAAYRFEVASDPAFTDPVVQTRTSLDNLTVSSLGEGTWYWRVVPVHAMHLLEQAAVPEVRTMVITRRAEMTAVTLTAPLPDSLFVVKDAASQGLSFSWVPCSEAEEYVLSVSRSKDMRNPSVTGASTQPWIVLSDRDARPLAESGGWYWAIRWKDKEGTLSPYSEARALRGIDASTGARLTFPPQGYTIADSLISTTRFGWQSAVPARTVFQLAEDQGFSTVAYEEPSAAGTLVAGQWKCGTWYWRVRTLNVDGSVLSETPPRMFQVVEPLPEPRLREPASGGTVRLRPEDSYTFSWDSVPGADSYRFGLYRIPIGSEKGPDRVAAGTAADSHEIERYSSERSDTTIQVPLGSYPPGAYRVRLQAYSRDKASTTRIVGYRGSVEFSLEPLSHVRLSTPDDGARIAGLEARRHGVALTWNASDRPESSEVLLARDPELHLIVLRADGTRGAVSADRLPAGDYFWTVRARLNGSDISALRTSRFTVLPIQLLPAPVQLFPASGGTFGPAELRRLSAIRFLWQAVPDSTSYLFSLYQLSNPVPLIRSRSVKDCFYVLEDISILDRGEYRWTLEAQTLDKAGELEQPGMTAESRFRVDLPSLHTPALTGNEVFYGR